MPISIKSQVNCANLSVFKGPLLVLRDLSISKCCHTDVLSFNWGYMPTAVIMGLSFAHVNIAFWKELDMVFGHHLMSWLSLKELPLNVVDFRVSDSFHPHYIKFLKAGITAPVPCHKNSSAMMPGCVSLIVWNQIFLFTSWGRKGKELMCGLFLLTMTSSKTYL